MLSSLTLSFALSISPAPAVNLDSVSVQNIGTKRDQVRISEAL
jgi:hypothetical protein